MIWRAGTQIVVARGDAFWVIEPSGQVIRHTPQEWSIEDEHGRTSFAVKNGALVEHTILDRGPFGRHIDDTVIVAGLVVDTDPITLDYVATIIGDEGVKAEERREREQREGDARVAAIAGANDDHHLGADFARAQKALVSGIHRYPDELRAALLRTLIELAKARPSEAALAAYVRACLLACFVRDVPALAPVNDDDKIPQPLAHTLAARAHELDEAADGQDYVDASGNAAVFRGAAKAVRAAISSRD